MIYLYGLTALTLGMSLGVDLKKTLLALRTAWLEFFQILPALTLMIVLVTILLFLVPDKVIAAYLGNQNKWTGFLFATIFGSITIMPGFIAFPLCGILLKQGVSYMALSVFANTLMMVGIATFPLEKQYFGTRVALIRNGLSLIASVIVALVTGFFYGELFS
jgi:uncharacterized membrane protein YraQ (UPF0718 family)